MPRGYRGIILAALGWLILAASPPQQQRTEEQGQSEQAIANSLERIAGTLDRNNEPANYSAECQTDKERRDSDLCAQWKAADAASESASWTSWSWYLGLVGATIGFLTLCAAAAAAFFAKKASDHTGTGATAAVDALKHAKKVSATELRPWVSPNVIAKRIYRVGDRFSFEYDVVCRNHGQTVARSFRLHCRLDFPKVDERETARSWWDQWEPPTEPVKSVVMPGEDFVFPSWGHYARDIIPWRERSPGENTTLPIVVTTVFYRSEFDEEWHRTDRAFTLGTVGDEGAEEFVRADLGSCGPDKVIARPFSGSMAT